jgi:hypothetical protein
MVFNIIGFQIGWFACVLGAAYLAPWLGVFNALFILMLHCKRSKHKQAENNLLLLAALFGLVFDSLLLQLGWVSFEPVAYWPDALSPPWMIALWALFASTLNISLNWLKKYTLVACLLGAVSGPLCYWAGERLGALHLVNFNMAMVYLAVGWAIAVPLLLKVASTLLNKETNRV